MAQMVLLLLRRRVGSASGAVAAPAHGELVEPGAGELASVVARPRLRRGRGNLGRGRSRCPLACARGALRHRASPPSQILRFAQNDKGGCSCVAPRKDSAGGAASTPARGELVEPCPGAWASVVARTRPRRGRGNLGRGRSRCHLACAWDTPRHRASPPLQILRFAQNDKRGRPCLAPRKDSAGGVAVTPARGELVEP